MSFTSTPLLSTTHRQTITIDWSNALSKFSSTEENIAKAMKWLQQYPNTQDIHVRIHSLSGPLLKRSLMKLGCKVTTSQAMKS